MHKRWFRTIFSRMMFMQCTTVAVAVLVIGVVLAVIVYAGRIGEYGTQLNRYAQNARAVIASEGDYAETHLKNLAADNDLLVERIGEHEDVIAIYADSRWEAYAKQTLSETDYRGILEHAGSVGMTTRSYFRNAGFPVLTSYCTVGNDLGDGVLLVSGDLTPISGITLT